jgi:hypothetical protein
VGIYKRLVAERLIAYGSHPLRAVCTEVSLPLLLNHGFHEVRRRGRFTEVWRG